MALPASVSYGLTSCLMGKNKAADLEKLQALQATLRKKAEAEAAAVAAAAEKEMPPPAPPAKKPRKSKKVEPPKEPSDSKEADEAPSASAPAASSKKRSRPSGAEPDGPPKAKAKAKSSPKAIKEPDFDITWQNHGRLMKHFGITEDEATACLLAVVGEDESGKKFWSKFSKKDPEPAVNPAPEPAVNPAPEPVTSKDTSIFTAPLQSKAERKAERAARQEMEESQFQSTEEDSDEDGPCEADDLEAEVADGDEPDEDGDTESSVVSGGRPDSPSPPGASQVPVPDELAIDTMDTLPMEEPVITPVPSKPDAGEEARADLAKKLRARPTPAKSSPKDQARHAQIMNKFDEVLPSTFMLVCVPMHPGPLSRLVTVVLLLLPQISCDLSCASDSSSIFSICVFGCCLLSPSSWFAPFLNGNVISFTPAALQVLLDSSLGPG